MPIYQLYNFPGFILASLFYYHEDDTMQNISLGSDSIFYQLHIFKPNQLLKHDLKMCLSALSTQVSSVQFS